MKHVSKSSRANWSRLLKTLPVLAAVVGIAVTSPAYAGAATGEPYLIGVSGPLTGQDAQYGTQWKRGFDLALEQINSQGGIKGRPLAYDFEDSRGDPRQAVSIAQKFVAIRAFCWSWVTCRARPRWRPRRFISGHNSCNSASPIHTPTSPRVATTCGAPH
jgi:ABC-type branched-chain amino acid transport systems, periplasmic component